MTRDRRGRRRRRISILVPVASMGDIAMLLMIFFFLCSEVVREPPGRRIALPRTVDAEQIKERGRAVVTIDAGGKIFLNREPVEDSEAVKWAVAALLEDVRRRKGRLDEADKIVIFKCDMNVKNVFRPVLAAIAEGGGTIAAAGEKIAQRRTAGIKVK